MNKYEEMLELDKDALDPREDFFACWFFAEIVQFGVFANVFMSQIGIV